MRRPVSCVSVAVRALAFAVCCIGLPVQSAAQCPTFSGIRWAGGQTVKYDLSNLPSQFHSAATAAIGKANAFATAAKTGVQFSLQGPNDRIVSFVVNTSIAGVGQLEKTSSGGIVTNAEVRINPNATFSGTNKVLDPNFPGYTDAVVLTFFHELVHSLGLNNVAFENATFGGSVMNEPINARNNSNNYVAWDATNCDRETVDNNYPDWSGEPDYCANGGCTPGYAPMGTPGCSEASIDECGCCLTYSPIVLDLSGDGVRFSSVDEGVAFDINDMGRRFKLGWPVATDDVWLWLDRNGNGIVDNGGELFGNATRLSNGRPAQNGFVALAELDANADDMIDSQDALFHVLRVWSDANRDGVSQAEETSMLTTTEVSGIELSYRESRRTDQHGNVFRYRSVLHLSGGKGRTWAWDVYPAVAPLSSSATPVDCAIASALRRSAPSVNLTAAPLNFARERYELRRRTTSGGGQTPMGGSLAAEASQWSVDLLRLGARR